MKKNKLYTLDSEINITGTNINLNSDLLVVVSNITAILWCSVLAFLNYHTHSICIYFDVISLLVLIVTFVLFQVTKKRNSDSLKRAIVLYQTLILLLDSASWYIISYLKNENIFLMIFLFYFIISLSPFIIYIFVRPYKRTIQSKKKGFIISCFSIFLFPRALDATLNLMNIRIPTFIQQTLFLVSSTMLILLFIVIISLLGSENKYIRHQEKFKSYKEHDLKKNKK
ncbi:MAG: hypothetical protein LBB10_01890 [Bifidobacteriaceae bacterium]|jgi:hypothetical protein|nr:hypothetical protein [Bifidobacteriaceae bacterium]